MGKYPFTAVLGFAILSAFMGQFGTRAVDAMSHLIIRFGWCDAQNGDCLFFWQVIVLLALFGIAFSSDRLLNNYRNWNKVKFSDWDTFHFAGVKIQNDTWIDLRECTAELIDLISDREIKLGIPGFSSQDLSRIQLPSRLCWWEDGEYKSTVNIGRGKEGFLAIAYPVPDEEQKLKGVKFLYKVATTTTSYLDPFSKGDVLVRISAQTKDETLPLKRLRVRLEVDGDKVLVKNIADESGKKIL